MRRWTIFTVVAVLVILAGGYLLLVKPQKSKVASLHTQTAQQQQANDLLLTQITALQSEEKQLPQQQLLLQRFATEVPDNPAQPTLIRQLVTAAHGAGIDLVSITPGAPAAVTVSTASRTTTGGTTTGAQSLAAPAATAGQLYSMPVSLSIVGSYPNVESFFSSLEKLPRALVVSGFNLCPEVSSGIGSGCTGPPEPGNKVAPPDAVGGTLSATVFFASAVAPATTGTQTLGGATTPAAGTTPAPGTIPSPAAT